MEGFSFKILSNPRAHFWAFPLSCWRDLLLDRPSRPREAVRPPPARAASLRCPWPWPRDDAGSGVPGPCTSAVPLPLSLPGVEEEEKLCEPRWRWARRERIYFINGTCVVLVTTTFFFFLPESAMLSFPYYFRLYSQALFLSLIFQENSNDKSMKFSNG